MFKMSPIAMAVNLAGVAAALVVGSYAVHSFVDFDKTPPCMASYPAPTRLSLLTEHGAPASAMELQGRFGTDEWGLIENVEIVRSTKQRGSEVMQVKLPAGTSSAFQERAPRGGTGFSWTPDSMQNATGACLNYRMMLPENFEFAGGGMLPGLFGGHRVNPSSESEGKSGFATRVMWIDNGLVALGTTAPAGGEMRRLDDSALRLATGKWHQITTEAVLNSPGVKDGIVRLWVDGELAVEHTGVALRADDPFTISGVLSDVSYGRFSDPVAAPKDTMVQFGPFELSWK